MPKTRINNLASALANLFEEGDNFYVGISYDTYLQLEAKRSKYGLPKDFQDGEHFVPHAKGATTKTNVKGKLIRREPQHKTTKTIHVDYIRKKDGARIEYKYDRDVWAKVLSDQFQMGLTFATANDGTRLVISPGLLYSQTSDHPARNKHAINMFLEVFGMYEPLLEDLTYAIGRSDVRLAGPILPPGELDEERYNTYVRLAEAKLGDPNAIQAFRERLDTIKALNPVVCKEGSDGFNGYTAYTFPSKGIVIAESIWYGDATYIFPHENHEALLMLDKQEVRENKLMLKKFSHTDNWVQNILNYITKLPVVE